jgi:hypothetical protein
MPMPRSSTSKRTSVWLSRSSSGRARMYTLPCSENLIALLVKFSSTCSSRSGSPRSGCDKPGPDLEHQRPVPWPKPLSPSWLAMLRISASSVKVEHLQLHLAGLDLGEVEDVVDDAQQVLARVVDLLQVVALLGMGDRFERQVRTCR